MTQQLKLRVAAAWYRARNAEGDDATAAHLEAMAEQIGSGLFPEVPEIADDALQIAQSIASSLPAAALAELKRLVTARQELTKETNT